MSEFTEVTEESWFSRIAGAIKGIVVGIVLFLVSFPVLWMNEGCAVKQYRALTEGANTAVSVSTDTVDKNNDGKPIHLSGLLAAKGVLKDSAFPVSVTDQLGLARKVQMYQWKEVVNSKTEKKIGGGTTTTKTYSYEKVWSDSLISSQAFKKKDDHQNPSAMPVKSESHSPKSVTIGAFTLGDQLKSMMGGHAALSLNLDAANVPAQIGGRKVHVQSDSIYIGADPANAAIGDVKVSFTSLAPYKVTVVARQSGSELVSHATSNGVNLLEMRKGTLSLDEVISQAKSGNATKTWIIRFVGFLMMVIGIGMILAPLSVIGDIVPFIGNLIGAGTTLIAIAVAFVFSFLTISIAWIVYRPMIAIPLLIVAVGAGIFVGMKALKRQEA